MTPKTITRLIPVLLLACAFATAGAQPPVKAPKQKKALPAASQPASPAPNAAADSMMALMQKLGTPGPQHEALRKMEGTWKCAVKAYSPSGDVSASEGTSENQMILGGRYLQQHFKGTMMDAPAEGYGITGYDNATHHYVFTWIDNMSTAIMTGSGDMDEAGKTLTVATTSPGPDGQPMSFRMVTMILDANTHVFSMYGPMGGKPDALMMQITYTRQ